MFSTGRNIGIPHLDKFGHLGGFSSGFFGIAGGPGGGQPQGPAFEERRQATLQDAKLKQGLKPFWFATGQDDFLVETSRATVAMFKKHGFDVVYREPMARTPGASGASTCTSSRSSCSPETIAAIKARDRLPTRLAPLPVRVRSPPDDARDPVLTPFATGISAFCSSEPSLPGCDFLLRL